MSETWLPVIEEKQLAENSRRVVSLGGAAILLIRMQGNEIYAIENACPHMACPLTKGALDGYILTCPCHDWRFDIRSGVFLDAPEIKIPMYETRLTGGSICLKREEP
jgi:nitrite reductase/ring-hydroxylating ferredoxin subunit